MIDTIAIPFIVDLSLPEAKRKHCDLIALCLNASHQVSGDDDVIFYNQPRHPRFDISVKPPHYSLHIDPQQFPASGMVLVLATSDPPSILASINPLSITLTTKAGTMRKWSVPGGAPVVEICTLMAIQPGRVIVQHWNALYHEPLAEVLTRFGVIVDAPDSPKTAPQPVIADSLATLRQPVVLPRITRILSIEACIKRRFMDGDLLPPGLACCYLTSTRQSGLSWPWDEGLWELPQTPVHWQQEDDRQIILVPVDHLDNLQRLWIFLHTPYWQMDLQQSVNYCVIAVDGKPQCRLAITSGRGRVLLLARIERQPNDIRLIPDRLSTPDLATLSRQRQIPFEPTASWH